MAQQTKIPVLLVLAIALFSGVSGAAVPGGDSAASQEARFREERQTGKTDLRPEQEQPTPDFLKDQSEQKTEPAPSGSTVKIPVQKIHFIGNYSIASDELEPLVRELVGREATLDDIQAAVSRVKRYYREKGYVATYAYVPRQEVQDGTLSIDVIEGRLGEFRIEGARFHDPAMLRREFSIQTGEVLTYEKIRRDLNRLNRNEDIQARLALEAGKEIGTTDAVVTIEDRYPIHLSVDLDNQGTQNTGQYRWGTNLRHNNLTGHSDQLSSTVQVSSGTAAMGLGYELPLLETPARVGYQFSRADVDIGGDFESLAAEGMATTHSVYVTRPLWEGPVSVSGTAGLDFKNVKNKLFGEVSGEDDLRIARFETLVNRESEGSKTLLTGGLYFGLPGIFGGSEKVEPFATRTGAGGEFFAARTQGVHYRQLAEEFLLTFRGSAQASGNQLPPSEQFRLGGARSVRGYSESDTLADYGAQVSAELFFPIGFVPDDWRLPTGETVRKSLQGFVFADLGWGEIHQPVAGQQNHRTLSGIGAGIRLHLGGKFYARAEWGFPMGDEPSDGRNSAFYFTVSYDFF